MSRSAIHERLDDEARIRGSSDRGFGFVLAAVAGAVGLWPLTSSGAIRLWALALAALFLVLALARPQWLGPFNRAWMRLGLLLNAVASPLVLGLLFYLTVTPTGLLMRALGKDPLRLRFEPGAKSYWIERRPPGPAPETMRNQF